MKRKASALWKAIQRSMPRRSGFKVYAVIDASATRVNCIANNLVRFIQAGVVPTSTNAVLSETHRTWNRPEAAELAKALRARGPKLRAVMKSYQKAQDVISRRMN